MLLRRRDALEDSSGTSLRAGRRTLVLLSLVAVVGAPAGILRALCAGHSCDEPANASSEVPFCSLPQRTRERVAAGFREGRSPDVLAVAEEPGLVAGPEEVPWPAVGDEDATRVPLAFWGAGVDPEAVIPAGTGVDAIAPTVAAILGFEDRPHPDVRSGEEIPGVASSEPALLAVEIVWVGRGARDLQAGTTPFVDSAIGSGSATLDGDTVSVPVDPAAVLTTIGTGGRPAQHGITGTLVRDQLGRLRKAWGPAGPPSVIAALGDDLDEVLGQEPVIGMAAGRRSYRGAIGGDWYVDVDRDAFVKTDKGDEARGARTLLRRPFGEDDVPDLAVVVVEGGPETLDETVRTVVERAGRISGGSAAFVLTATGASPPGEAFEATAIPGEGTGSLVEAAAPGGLFLDQKELARRQVSEDEVLRALTGMPVPDGPGRLFADVFPAIAVAFGRYC